MTYEAWLDRYWRPYMGGDPLGPQEASIRGVLHMVEAYEHAGRGAGKTTLWVALARFFCDDDGIQWLPAWHTPSFPRTTEYEVSASIAIDGLQEMLGG